jgi:hypothetical protein
MSLPPFFVMIHRACPSGLDLVCSHDHLLIDSPPSSQENKNAPPGRTLPEKASECLVRPRFCLRWARSYGHPGFMVLLPTGSFALPSTIGDPRDNARDRLDVAHLS